MSAKKAITTIGLIIVFLSLGIGAYFVYQKGLLTTSVDDSIKPSKVRITNISSDSFSVSWMTTSATKGSVIFGSGSKLEEIALDDRDQLTGQSGTYFTHHITLKNLQPSLAYQFKLRSGDKDILFDNEGKNFSQKTAPNLGTTPATDIINGKLVTTDGSPAENSLVYINIAGVTPISTLSKKDGTYLSSLSSARNSQLTGYANYDKKNTLIEISIYGKDLSSSGKTISSNKSPVPDIILGQSFDHSQPELANIPKDPIVEQNLGMGSTPTPTPTPTPKVTDPEEELEELQESTDEAELESFPMTAEAVIIDVPAYSGEEFNTTKPTFSGSGEAGTIMTVQLDGVAQSGSITVPSSGEWRYTPATALTAGSHVFTLSYVDNNGDQATVEEDFEVVLGALTSGSGGIPEAEASGSAKVSPTPSPTPKVRAAMPSTTSGTPQSGVNLPTFLLLILGSSSIIIGLNWKKYFSLK